MCTEIGEVSTGRKGCFVGEILIRLNLVGDAYVITNVSEKEDLSGQL